MSCLLNKGKIKGESLPQNPQPNTPETIDLYTSKSKIYPRAVRGRFNNLRILFVIGTQLVFFGLPWLNWNGRQALHFDLIERKLYLFALTLWPQDFVYLTGLLICCALSLLTWSAIAGRLWCGYACPQTIYSLIMLWIEQCIEGDHRARIKLDKAPMNTRKFCLKFIKHGLMILFSLWTGLTLVGYFTPIRDLWTAAPNFDYGQWEACWIFLCAGLTYLLAGFMREEVCKSMCPYARFQSVMFDAETLIISYDEKRGEPRGARKKKTSQTADGLGDCINCNICVQVCPVGIDIRNGLQYECIGCGACIDACDTVMDNMGYPRGLIRYTTENALKRQFSMGTVVSILHRPRVLLHALVLVITITTAIGFMLTRKPFKVDVIRDRASLVRSTSSGWLENTYIMKIINTTEKNQDLKITASGLPGLKVETDRSQITVPPASDIDVTLHVEANPEYATKGSHEIYFQIQSINQPSLRVEEKSTFIGE